MSDAKCSKALSSFNSAPSSDPTNARRPFKISDEGRTRKIGVVVASYNELLSVVQRRFPSFDRRLDRILVDADDTEIDNEDYFQTLSADTTFRIVSCHDQARRMDAPAVIKREKLDDDSKLSRNHIRHDLQKKELSVKPVIPNYTKTESTDDTADSDCGDVVEIKAEPKVVDVIDITEDDGNSVNSCPPGCSGEKIENAICGEQPQEHKSNREPAVVFDVEALHGDSIVESLPPGQIANEETTSHATTRISKTEIKTQSSTCQNTNADVRSQTNATKILGEEKSLQIGDVQTCSAETVSHSSATSDSNAESIPHIIASLISNGVGTSHTSAIQIANAEAATANIMHSQEARAETAAAKTFSSETSVHVHFHVPNADTNFEPISTHISPAPDDVGLRRRAAMDRSFAVCVRTQTGKTFPLQVRSSDSIAVLKKMIQARQGFRADLQLLTARGLRLEDERTISDYNIQQADAVNVKVDGYYNTRPFYIETETSLGECFRMKVTSADKVGKLRYKVSVTVGLPYKHTVLGCEVFTLLNGNILAQYDIRPGSRILWCRSREELF